jgi:hypothetical protein
MIPVDITNKTRELAKAQPEYVTLPIEDENVDGVNMMKSMWKPNAFERQAIIDGGHVILCVCGTIHPPVQVLTVDKFGKLIE